MEYRGVTNYHFKKGMEEEGAKFVENEILKRAVEMGCQNVEFWQDHNNPLHYVSTGTWKEEKGSQKFQSMMDTRQKQIAKFCTEAPKRTVYRLKARCTEKGLKAA